MTVFSGIRGLAVAVLLGSCCWGQAGLSISSGSAAAGGTLALNLSFAGNNTQAASLQFRLDYLPGSVGGVNIAATSILSGAGKQIACAGGAGTYTCVVYGGAGAIPDGAIASVQASLPATASNSGITLSNALAASTAAAAISVSAGSGSITVTTGAASSTLSSLSCAPASLAPYASANCTAALSGAAPSGGALVALSADSASVSLPGSVNVPAGASSAAFTVTAGSVSSGASVPVTITGIMGGISRTASVVISSGSLSGIRVNAGGGAYTASNGAVWSADANYSGGYTWSTSANAAGTTDPAIYQTQRYGVFSYSLLVPNGAYTVTLRFAEMALSGAGQRVFNVAINGAPALSNFDIFAQAGGALKALDKSFPVTVTNGQVFIDFTAGAANWPTVNGIEIVASTGATSPGPTSSGAALVRVNSGGAAYIDPSGASWSADTGYSGGSTWSTAAIASGTTAPVLYQTQRYGVFNYQFPAPNGTYTVTLRFAEMALSGAGQRVFNVAINGAPALSNFDIFAQAGGALKALDKSFPVTVTNGQIFIDFTAGAANWPTVNGIEIVSSTGSTSPGSSSAGAAVVRVNNGGPLYVDPSGASWAADANYSGGSTWSTAALASGTTSPALYQTQRYGVFNYQFPVANGNYTVTLHFAEMALGGAGQRVFNVAINGSPALSNFDIFAEAGGALKALDKSFPVTVTNGQIYIDFTAGAANWPTVNAIEIVAQ